MCQITRNTALDHIRKANRRPESPLEETDINQITDEGMAIAEQRDLNYCLNQLKQEPRRVIVLAYVHGFSHSELADKLSTPIGTLKSWIRRGLKELELCLKN
jgi:RNA polymerase sigma-70 factor (ECF subfamily)